MSHIRYNRSFTVKYSIEPQTVNVEDKDLQMELLKIQNRDWVEIGQELADFLAIGVDAHIHFQVFDKRESPCPAKYFTPENLVELTEMMESVSDWEYVCNP